ncbi:protein asteroid homolog 1-like [Colossoma macropomum]|uniref:protein asteroid homolog 1-like n=1 Tax=Colossoma macropomum TaxID=42526 RepID=UPI0018653E1F|nr:protein asteroid homolog 1-like [Colossoma macropomum]XP_036414366.1 protein asteroid homolog 1-like [Colossoma macropomum]
MGVQGLKTYMEGNSDVLKRRNFRNSRLVIDGSNLYYSLYFQSHLDQAHGGEYEGFEKVVSRFFANLRICKIKPYVVLDGGDDISNKKFDTLKKRAEDRIKRTDALSKGRRGEALPILIKNVFKQVLRKLKVPLIQCVAEADWEVAALANEWNCPVLSNDSDFYIFDIKGGFLPLSDFHWRKVKSIRQSDKKYIPASWYSVSNLCSTLNCMNKQLLPIFATILGNDYAHLDKTLFPNWTKFSLTPGGNRNIDGLLRWLSRHKCPKDAIKALRSTITNPRDSATVLKVLKQGLQEYRLTPSSIAQFFKRGEPQSKLPRPLQSLPEWFLKALGEGKLNSILLDVLTLHRVTLNFSVQDFSLCSNNLTSRPIRQVIYGLMLQATAEEEQYEVEEYDRQGLTLTSSTVPAILTNLQLDTLWETPQNLRLEVFLDALCVSQAPDELLVPANLQLAVYVTCYWLKRAEPEPRPEFFWALLVGLVYGELSRDPLTEKELPKRLRNLKSCKEETPLDLEAAHAYSQWQGSLRDSICLNQLLNNPVPEPEYARLYSGLFLHHVITEMSRGITPESLLAGAPHALHLYQTLREAVERELDEDLVRRMRAKVKRAQPSERPARRELTDDISMYLIYEDDEEDPRTGKKGKADNQDDEISEQKCLVRTRHKAKSRTSKRDPKAKKSERSCWE